MINTLLSAVLQVLVFTLVPFLWYLLTKRSAKGFLNYIGLRKSTRRGNYLAILVFILMAPPLLALAFISPEFKAVMTDPNSVTGMIRQIGFGGEAVITIFIVAIFKTSFAEEVLFRGFVAKRLISVTSYQTGNIIQAIIFGLIHAALFMTISRDALFLTLIFVFPAVGAYFMVHINEKLAGGSILPGWIAHGLANVISYSVIGFLI